MRRISFGRVVEITVFEAWRKRVKIMSPPYVIYLISMSLSFLIYKIFSLFL